MKNLLKNFTKRTEQTVRNLINHRVFIYVCLVFSITMLPATLSSALLPPLPKVLKKVEVVKRLDVKLKHASFILNENPSVPYAHAVQIVDAIHEAAEKYGVKHQVVLCLMQVESTYDQTSKSHKGALGLMQVRPKVWLVKQDNSKDLVSVGIAKTKKDLLDVRTNIMAGTYILRVYLDEAEKKGVANPYKYALTRYYGGYKNEHYKKTMTVMARLKNFKQLKGNQDENS